MARGIFALALILSLFIPATGLAQQPPGRRTQTPGQGVPQPLEFKDILNRELRIRFPKEELFIDQIVELTRKGTFSQQFVLAITRNAQQRSIIYPFPYFQAMMIRVGQMKGVFIRPN